MSYTPTNWSTGDTITASSMNKIENGIANASSGIGYDAIIWFYADTWHIEGDFATALAKAQQGIPLLVAQVEYAMSAGWYTTILTDMHYPIMYEETYPNRIFIQFTAGIGLSWTENGIQYVD